jgi:D-alanyl-D-alanine carboxypeptidase (penicillin-binding protein 5/6)
MHLPPRAPADDDVDAYRRSVERQLRESAKAHRRWKRRQQRLIALLAVLALLAVGLLTRGLFLLLPSGSGATQAAPTPSATLAPSPTPHPKPSAPAIQAAAGMLVNVDSGAVLFRQDADEKLAMASTTKIMTAVLALQYGQLDAPVTIGYDPVSEETADNTRMGLSVGEVLTLRDLLYGMLLPSGDDAAIAVADAISGSRSRFVALMNTKARWLGLTHTHYTNPDGLDAPGHYTSASDLIKLTEYALSFKEFVAIVATSEYKIPLTNQHKGYDLMNTNHLLGANGYPGADGVKTGTTGDAGDCLVFSATRNDAHLLGVVLGDPTDDARFQDARALLDWGFAVVADG